MIREANKNDCINLAILSLDVWLQTYAIDGINTEISSYVLSKFTESNFEQILLNKKYKLLVYVDENYLRGYALINLESNYQSENYGFEIDKLYVQGSFQGRNIGASLLSEVETRYGSRFWLYTWVHNKSIGFYKKYGFKDVGKYSFELGSETVENRVFSYVGDSDKK